MEEDDKKYFYKELAENAYIFPLICNEEEHPEFLVFKHEGYTVMCNGELMKKFIKFTDKNIAIINDIFPKEFRCFKLDEFLAAKLILIGINCNENYALSCSTRFVTVEDQLYAVKMLSCNKSRGLGFVMMKYDLIEDDASLGRFMYMNQSTNYFLTKFGGVCELNRDPYLLEILSGYGKTGTITFTNRMFGMFDPVTSNVYELADQPNERYVEMNNYKMVQFDTIDSVKNWIGPDGEERCPFINFCSIKLISKYLRIGKWINRILHPDFKFSYEYINKQQQA